MFIICVHFLFIENKQKRKNNKQKKKKLPYPSPPPLRLPFSVLACQTQIELQTNKMETVGALQINEREPFQALSSNFPATGSLNKILCTTAASLSIVGTLFIIGTFLKWPDLRSNSRKIIVFISIGDLFVAMSNAVGLYTETRALVCKIQAALNIAALLSSFFWTVYLSFYIYMTVCRKITLQSEKRIMLFFLLTAWGIPLTIAATAYGVRAVGNSKNVMSSGWCWIKYSLNDETWPWQKMLFWMCMTGKGCEILSYIAICVCYFLVKCQIRREVRGIQFFCRCSLHRSIILKLY